jgi:hypothetical protein
MGASSSQSLHSASEEMVGITGGGGGGGEGARERMGVGVGYVREGLEGLKCVT